MLTQVFSDRGVMVRSFGHMAALAAFGAACTSVLACSGFSGEGCAASRTCTPKHGTGGDTSEGDAAPVSAAGSGGSTGNGGQVGAGGNGAPLAAAGSDGVGGAQSSGPAGGAAGRAADPNGSAADAGSIDAGAGDADSGSSRGTDGGPDGGAICRAGFANCNDDPADGCEAELATNSQHCGACATSCSANGTSANACIQGKCAPTCDTKHADCDKNGTNGCEVDITAVRSCGACGHDCQGGACVGGQCQPKVLADGVVYPFRLVVDAKYAYWLDQPTDGGGRLVMRASVAGGGASAVSGRGVGTGLATDGTSVYWGVPSTSTSTELANGVLYMAPPNPEGELQTVADPSAIAADGQNVYWANERTNQILRARREGSQGLPLVSGVQLVSCLKVDGTSLFGITDGARSLFSVPVDGGGVTRLMTIDARMLSVTSSALAVDTTHVYAWFQDDKSVLHLEQLDRTTFAPTRELTTSPSVVGVYTPLEYANGYVYYVQDDGIYRVSTTKTESPVQVVKSTSLAIGMAVYGGALYWAENGSSTPSSLKKLAVF